MASVVAVGLEPPVARVLGHSAQVYRVDPAAAADRLAVAGPMPVVLALPVKVMKAAMPLHQPEITQAAAAVVLVLLVATHPQQWEAMEETAYRRQ